MTGAAGDYTEMSKTTVRGLLCAARLHYSTSSTYPSLLGGALALQHGIFDLDLFLVVYSSTLVGHVLMEIKDELDDFRVYRSQFSHKGRRLPPTLFSGGSGAMSTGQLTERGAVHALVVVGCLYAALAVIVILRAGLVMLCFGAVGSFWLLGYSDPRTRLVSKGLGEIGLLICFGPLIGAGTFFALALVSVSDVGRVVAIPSLADWVVFMPLGLIQFAMIHIQESFDLPEDRLVQKRTLVVRFGETYAFFVSVISLVATLFLIFLAGKNSPYFLVGALPLGWGLAELYKLQLRWRSGFEQWLRRYPLYYVHCLVFFSLFVPLALAAESSVTEKLLLLTISGFSWGLATWARKFVQNFTARSGVVKK